VDSESTPRAGPVALATGRIPSRGQLLRLIWALSWPVIVTFSLESVVGLVDMLMVGRLGAVAVAGVGVGMQILSAVTAAMFAVGTGALAVVARNIGAGRKSEADTALYQSLLVAGALGALTALPVIIWTPLAVRAFGVEEAVVGAGTAYTRWLLLGVPADAVVFVAALGLRGAGDMRTPLMVGATVGTLNVLGNYALIFGHFGCPALGVQGAAIASALSFAGGAVLSLALLARGGLALQLPRAERRPRLDVIGRILRIGYPAAVEHILMQIGFFLYILIASAYGTSAVAAYFIGVRILALSFLPGFGFSAAAGTLVGQNLGAGSPEQAERSGWESNRLAVYLMSAAGVAIFAAARPIARLFVDDPAVVADAVSFIRVLAAAQPLMAIDFTLTGALRGAGDTRFPLLAVLAGFYGCRLGFAYTLTSWLRWDVFWLWFALLGDYLARSILKAHRFRSGRWKHIQF